jgi:hypothetical protein
MHQELRNTALIQRLISLLGSEEQVEVQEEAALSLGYLAKDCQSLDLIMKLICSSHEQGRYSQKRRNEGSFEAFTGWRP